MPRLPDGVDNRQLVNRTRWASGPGDSSGSLFDGGFAGICFPVEYGGRA